MSDRAAHDPGDGESLAPLLRPALAWPLALGAAVAMVLTVLRLAIAMGLGRAQLEAHLDGLTIDGQTVRVEALKGDPLRDLRVARIAVHDADGPWMTADDLRLQWRPFDLLRGDFRVVSFDLDRLVVSRRPVMTDGDGEASDDEGSGWIRRVVIGRWRVARADIAAAPGIGAVSLQAEGGAFIEDGVVNVQAHAESVVDDGDAADITLQASRRRIDLRVEADGRPGGALSRALGVPQEAVRLSLRLDGGGGAGDASALLTVGARTALDLIAGWTRESAVAQFDAGLETWPHLARRYGARVGGRFERTPAPDSVWTLDLGSTEFSFQARGAELRRLPERDVEATISLSFRTPQQTFAGLGASLARLQWDGSLRWTPDGRVIDVVGALALRDLAAGGLRVDLIEGPLSFRRDDSRSQIRLRVSPEGLRSQNAAWATRLDGASILAVDAEYDSETQTARIRDARADAAGLSLRLNGTIDRRGAGQAALTASVSSLASLGAPGDGALEAAIDAQSASWTDGSWTLQASLSDTTAWPGVIADLFADGVDAAGGGRWTSDAWTIGALEASSDAVAAKMTGRVPFSQPASSNGELAASISPGASLAGGVLSEGGRLSVRRETSTDAPWTLEFLAPHVEMASARATDVALHGEARRNGESGSARLSAKAETNFGPLDANLQAAWNGASWEASGPSLRFGPWSGAGRASGRGGDVEMARMDGSYQPEAADARAEVAATWTAADGLDLSASTANLVLGLLELETGDLNLAGTLHALSWRARGTGAAYDLALAGDARAARDVQSLVLRDITGDLGGVELGLNAPLAVRRDRDGLRGDGALAIGAGDVRLKVAFAETVGLELRLADVPIKIARALVPDLDADGPVDGDINLARRDGTWRGAMKLTAPNVSAASVDAPAFRASIEATRDPDAWRLDARASSDAGFKLEANASVEAAPASLGPSANARLDAALSARGAIDAIAAAALGDAGIAEGAASINLRVNGQLNAPRATGEFALTDVAFEHAETGMRGTISSARADFIDDVLSIRPFPIVAPDGGRMELSGAVAMTEAHETEIVADFERFPLIRREDVRAVTTGSLRLGGAGPTLRRIDGALSFPSVSAQPSGSGVRTPPSLEVDVVRGVGPRPGGARPDPPDLGLDVAVRAENRVFLRGEGVESEWRFDFRIEGSAADPRLDGEAELIRGFARIAGARFALGAGRVTFQGAPEDGVLDLRATAPFDGGRAIIRVGGTIAAPDVALSSEPPLPDDEIMARVLFGRGSSSLSALQAAQLSLALGEIATGRDLDVVTRLRNRLSLDRFTIEDDADAGASLVGGKYLTDDVYLEVGTAGRTGLERVRIEWSPLRRFAVVSRFDARGDARVSVRWTRDY